MKKLTSLLFLLLFSSFQNFADNPEKIYVFFNVPGLNPTNAGQYKVAIEQQYNVVVDYYCVPAHIFAVPIENGVTEEQIITKVKALTNNSAVHLQNYSKADASAACAATRQ
jgi:hypothetical protein